MITRIGTSAQIKGSSYAKPCALATTGPITLSGTQSIDSVTANVGDRVLVKDQASGADNGIYIVSSGAWSRAVDMSTDDDVFQGLQVYINNGTTNNSKVFVLTTSGTITLGSTALTFVVESSGSYAPPVQSYFDNNIGILSGSLSAINIGNNVFVQPFNLPYPITMNYLRVPFQGAYNQSSIATTANTTIGLSGINNVYVNIYSKGTGINSQSLQYVTSGSGVIIQSIIGQIGAASNNQTVSYQLTYPFAGATGSSAASYNVSSASIVFSSGPLGSIMGGGASFRLLDIPITASLSAGAYWIGLQYSRTQSVTVVNSNLNMFAQIFAVAQDTRYIGALGSSSAVNTQGLRYGLGVASMSSSGITTNSIGLTNISVSNTLVHYNMLVPFQMIF